MWIAAELVRYATRRRSCPPRFTAATILVGGLTVFARWCAIEPPPDALSEIRIVQPEAAPPGSPPPPERLCRRSQSRRLLRRRSSLQAGADRGRAQAPLSEAEALPPRPAPGPPARKPVPLPAEAGPVRVPGPARADVEAGRAPAAAAEGRAASSAAPRAGREVEPMAPPPTVTDAPPAWEPRSPRSPRPRARCRASRRRREAAADVRSASRRPGSAACRPECPGRKSRRWCR